MSDDSLIRDEIARITGERPPEKRPIEKVGGLVHDPGSSALGPVSRFTKNFLGKDIKTLTLDIRRDAKPKFKSFVANLLHGFIDSSFNQYSYPGNQNNNGTYVNYSTPGQPSYLSYYYGSPTVTSPNGQVVPTGDRRYNWSEVVMNSWEAAEKVRDILRANIIRYGNVSIAELYEVLSDDDPNSPPPRVEITDPYFGWKNLDSVQIVNTGRGYHLQLPKPIQLK